jgi:CubicO group peptidase (beta-lactamase class C family)
MSAMGGKNMIGKALTALMVCAVLVQPVSAQAPGEISYHDEPVMPAGIEGQRIQSLLDTFNSGDTTGVRAFMENECTEEFRNFAPMEQHFDVFLSILRRTGSIDFHSVRTYIPPRDDRTVVIVKDRNYGSWHGVSFWFDEGEDRLVSGVWFSDARTPTNVEEPPLTEEAFVAEVSAFVEGLCDRDLFSGTVLVARGDEVLFSHACGEASKRFHAPIDLDTKFNLGSMNKMFTGTAITQLAERGDLSFDDTIDAYVDETWLPAEITQRITIHHLLTHTSGLGSYFNDTYDRSSRKLFREVDDYKLLVEGDTLAFEPGSDWQYSNTGMLLLGVVVESVTGRDYFDYVRDSIYGPAGMADTDCYDMDCPVENLAIGYFPSPECEGGWRNNYYEHVIRGGPAGGGFSTVGDLFRFARALMTGVLVSDESRALLWTDHNDRGYGYGFSIGEGNAGKIVGHGGGFAGINANLDIFVDQGYVAAVMTNIDGAGSPVDTRIRQLIGRIQ